MKTFQNILIVILAGLAYQAAGQDFRYADKIFVQIDTFRNIEYGQAQWLNNPISLLSDYNIHEGEETTELRSLFMDIFMPENDTISKRPAIIFSHSGAFLLGSRQSDDMVAFCDSFAHKGYVTATMDYRLGMGATVSRIFGVMVGLSVDGKNAKRAAYRATQDGRAAIRYLKKNAELYGIDSSHIFLVGSSAGAIQDLSVLYLNQDYEIPEQALSAPSLGGLDNAGPPGPGANPAAVVSMWGAAWDPVHIENNQTPLFLIHGENDNIVPFKKGIPLEGSVSDNPFVHFTMPETYGSFCIDSALTNRGIQHETYFVNGQGHEFYGVDTGMFPPEGPNQYWDTINQKITDFLFEQLQPSAGFNFELEENILKTTNLSSANDFVSWDFGDGNTDNAWETEHVYTRKGLYKLKLKVCNELMACDTASAVVNVSTLTVADDYSPDEISVFPNPVSKILYMRGIHFPVNVRLSDLTGQTHIVLHDFTENQIDVGSLHPGIYFVELRFGQNILVKKIIKK